MAKCDQGYPCEVCGGDVEGVLESDLYLRFVLGEVPLERLHLQAERHIRCNPGLAQYVVDDRFPVVPCEGFFDKRLLDAEYVRGEEARVSRGYRRLQAIPHLGLSIPEYPLHVTPDSEGDAIAPVP